MQTTLIAIAHDLHGRALYQSQQPLADVERVLTPEQALQLTLGLDVTVISRRGRIDYRRADAPALRDRAPRLWR